MNKTCNTSEIRKLKGKGKGKVQISQLPVVYETDLQIIESPTGCRKGTVELELSFWNFKFLNLNYE